VLLALRGATRVLWVNSAIKLFKNHQLIVHQVLSALAVSSDSLYAQEDHITILQTQTAPFALLQTIAELVLSLISVQLASCAKSPVTLSNPIRQERNAQLATTAQGAIIGKLCVRKKLNLLSSVHDK